MLQKLEQEVEDLKNGKMDYQFKIALLQSENCCLKSHIDCVRTAYEVCIIFHECDNRNNAKSLLRMNK